MGFASEILLPVEDGCANGMKNRWRAQGLCPEPRETVYFFLKCAEGEALSFFQDWPSFDKSSSRQFSKKLWLTAWFATIQSKKCASSNDSLKN